MLAAASSEVARAFVELGAVFVVLSLVARGAGRLGLSPVPFYLLGGLLLGPGGPLPLQVSEEFTQLAAEIGVLLLLFTLGLEYSAAELAREMRRSWSSGLLDLVLNSAPGVAVGFLLGWPAVACVLLGGVTYISSSGVISKLLDDLGRLGNRETPSVLSLLVFEDLVMAAYLPVVGVLLTGTSFTTGVRDVIVALAVVGVVIAVGARFGPQLSRGLDSPSDEAVLLGVMGGVLLVGGVVQSFEVSAAVGAFLVGLAISGPAQARAATVIGPLRDLFAAIFFVVFAVQVIPSDLVPVLAPAAALAAVGVATKVFTGWWAAGRRGVGVEGRWRAGTSLVPRGEFSIVIAGLGVAAGVDAPLGALATAYVLLLAVVGPLLTRLRAPAVLHRRFGPAPRPAGTAGRGGALP